MIPSIVPLAIARNFISASSRVDAHTDPAHVLPSNLYENENSLFALSARDIFQTKVKWHAVHPKPGDSNIETSMPAFRSRFATRQELTWPLLSIATPECTELISRESTLCWLAGPAPAVCWPLDPATQMQRSSHISAPLIT